MREQSPVAQLFPFAVPSDTDSQETTESCHNDAKLSLWLEDLFLSTYHESLSTMDKDSLARMYEKLKNQLHMSSRPPVRNEKLLSLHLRDLD